MRMPGYPLIRLPSRTVVEIQENKRNVISRRYHVKDDKQAIASWRLDLNRILHVFDVRSVTPVWTSLTPHSQTESRIDTHATGSDAHQDAANKHTIISDVHHDVTNAETIVSGRSDISNSRTGASDTRRSKLKTREGADGQNRAVSTARTLSPKKYLPLFRLTLGQRSRLQLNPVSDVCIQRTRRVTASATGKYAWNRFPYSSRRRFRGSSRRFKHSNCGL